MEPELRNDFREADYDGSELALDGGDIRRGGEGKVEGSKDGAGIGMEVENR